MEMHQFVQIQLNKKKQQAAEKATQPSTMPYYYYNNIYYYWWTSFWGAEAGTAVVPDGWDDLSMSSSLFKDIAKPHAVDDNDNDTTNKHNKI